MKRMRQFCRSACGAPAAGSVWSCCGWALPQPHALRITPLVLFTVCMGCGEDMTVKFGAVCHRRFDAAIGADWPRASAEIRQHAFYETTIGSTGAWRLERTATCARGGAPRPRDERCQRPRLLSAGSG